MGLFDYVVDFDTECQKCNTKLTKFQTKEEGRTLDSLNYKEVDYFYSLCTCGMWIEARLKAENRFLPSSKRNKDHYIITCSEFKLKEVNNHMNELPKGHIGWSPDYSCSGSSTDTQPLTIYKKTPPPILLDNIALLKERDTEIRCLKADNEELRSKVQELLKELDWLRYGSKDSCKNKEHKK